MTVAPIPKLNFSAAHDAWLGPYARCVSTDTYYSVCRDLIQEVVDIFDQPRLFHLGMDEETFSHQKYYAYALVRQHELWWHDLQWLVDEVERQNVRAWVWSDYFWHHPEAFLKRMPTSVLQSNWYYSPVFNKRRPAVNAYLELEAHGYDQMPTGSNHAHWDNLPLTVKYLRRRIDSARLKGFVQTPWTPTLPEWHEHHIAAIDAVAEAMKHA